MLKFSVTALLFLPVFLFAQVAPKEITIGFIPGGERETLKKGAVLIAKELQSQLGLSVNVFISKDYGKLLEAIKQKRVDFAFLSANALVATEQQTPMKILLKKVWREPFYYSALIVPKSSKTSKVQELKGKKVAFVDPKSTSGYLYPLAMLKKHDWDHAFFGETKFSGSHAASVSMLEEKKVDAIFVFSDDKEGANSAWTKFVSHPRDKQNFKILWVSEPIPSDPFCVRQDFYDQFPKLTHTIMMALIDAHEKLSKNKEVLDVIGEHGMIPATSKQYDPVREMVKELKLQVIE
jgi:phosphonate transport system substrate-binding protein